MKNQYGATEILQLPLFLDTGQTCLDLENWNRKHVWEPPDIAETTLSQSAWELLSPSPAQTWLAHSWTPTRSYLNHLWSLCLDEGQEFDRMTFIFISCPSIPFSYFLQDIDVLWFALYPWRRLWRYAMKKIISIASRLLISQWVHESANYFNDIYIVKSGS